MALACVSAGAQELKEGYIVWGTSSDKMGQTITDWQPGQTLSEDDHFFISRIKPKARFRNVATQVRQNITEANDKKLIAWIPVNDEAKNALPDGVFDSEVFTLWPSVTHWLTSAFCLTYVCTCPGVKCVCAKASVSMWTVTSPGSGVPRSSLW